MSKELLKTLKESISGSTEAAPASPAEEKPADVPVQPVKRPDPVAPAGEKAAAKTRKPAAPKAAPAVSKGDTKKTIAGQKPQGISGIEELYELLKEEKQDFTFGRRIVYVDDEIGEVLDFLRKKAKINSNALTSYLLKQFFLENRQLLQELKDRKENKFLA